MSLRSLPSCLPLPPPLPSSPLPASLAFLPLLFLMVAACPSGPRSGIGGVALVGPTRPVQRAGETQDEVPYPTTLLILVAEDHRPVARVSTGPDGRFRIDLPPGDYIVTGAAPAGRTRPRAGEEAVQVQAGRVASVTLRFDSGMR